MRAVCRTPLDAASPVPSTKSRVARRLFSQTAVKHGASFVSINVDELKAGDVLLFQASTKASAAVALVQLSFFDQWTARWTHCGILDENFSVWDAMPRSNVRCRSLSDVLRRRETLAVVRPLTHIDPKQLSRSLVEFSDGAYRVQIQTGKRLAARRLGVDASIRLPVSDRSTLCSLFVADVLRHSTKHGFFAGLPIALPADFLTDPDFAEVPLRWTTLEVDPGL